LFEALVMLFTGTIILGLFLKLFFRDIKLGWNISISFIVIFTILVFMALEYH